MYPDYKLDSPCSMSCTNVVFCNKALLSVCREELLVIAISQAGSLGIPMISFWSTLQLDITHSQFWVLHFVTGGIQLGIYLLYYLAVLFRSPLYMNTF